MLCDKRVKHCSFRRRLYVDLCHQFSSTLPTQDALCQICVLPRRHRLFELADLLKENLCITTSSLNVVVIIALTFASPR